MTPPKHSYGAQPLSKRDPPLLGNTSKTTASVLTSPDFIQKRALPLPSGLYQHPYGAPSLPQHDHAGAVCSLPSIWDALGPHMLELPQFRNTSSIAAYLPSVQGIPVSTYNKFQYREAPQSTASIQVPRSLPSIEEAPVVQYGASLNNTLQTSWTHPSTSYKYISATGTLDLLAKNTGASFYPTAMPAIAQVSGQGLHVSALLNKSSNTIPEGREHMATFKSHHNAQHPLPCTARTTSEPNDKLIEEYSTGKSCTEIAKPFSDRTGGSCSYRFRHGWYDEVKSRRERRESWKQISEDLRYRNSRALRNRFYALRERFSQLQSLKTAHPNAVMTRKPWTPEEDEIIRTGRKNGETSKEIHSRLSHRTLAACKARILIICSRTRPPSQIWSRDDVAKLETLVRKYGKEWEEISRQFEGRTPGACRMRYHEIQKW